MFKKYRPFLRASAMDMMAWRFNILVWAVVTVFEVACLIFLWLAVYSSSEGGIDASINGFTYKEMISYVVLTTVFGFVTFNNDTLWYINQDIRKGTIGNYVIKPISYRGKFVASNLGAFFNDVYSVWHSFIWSKPRSVNWYWFFTNHFCLGFYRTYWTILDCQCYSLFIE